jgi:hypothetical protein
MLHSWLLFLRFLFWFFTSLINQLHQLACFFTWVHLRKATPVLRMRCYYYCCEQFRTLFVIPAAAVTWFRNWAHWTTFVMHACDQEVLLLRIFLHHLLHKNSDRSSIWDWQEHAGVQKKNPHHTRDWRWWQQNEFLESCTHNVLTIYQSYEILSPLTYSDPPTLLEFSKMAYSPNLWEVFYFSLFFIQISDFLCHMWAFQRGI